MSAFSPGLKLGRKAPLVGLAAPAALDELLERPRARAAGADTEADAKAVVAEAGAGACAAAAAGAGGGGGSGGGGWLEVSCSVSSSSSSTDAIAEASFFFSTCHWCSTWLSACHAYDETKPDTAGQLHPRGWCLAETWGSPRHDRAL